MRRRHVSFIDARDAGLDVIDTNDGERFPFTCVTVKWDKRARRRWRRMARSRSYAMRVLMDIRGGMESLMGLLREVGKHGANAGPLQWASCAHRAMARPASHIGLENGGHIRLTPPAILKVESDEFRMWAASHRLDPIRPGHPPAE